MSVSITEALLLFGILGILAGGFAFLFRTLVQTKDDRIQELVGERDYYRSAALFERELPMERHPSALPPGTSIVIHEDKDKDDDAKSSEPDRVAYWVLGIQAVVSLIVLIGSFLLIALPTEAAVNSLAANLIIFVIGVWLGRGIDYATLKRKAK